MIWIDTDLIIPPDALVRLVKMSNAGMPIAAGIYRRAMLDKDHQFLLTRRTIDEWATLEELRRTLTAVSRGSVCLPVVFHRATRGI